MNNNITINDICYFGFADSVTIKEETTQDIKKLALTTGKKYKANGFGFFWPLSLLICNDNGEYIDCPLSCFTPDEHPKSFDDFYGSLLLKEKIIKKNPSQYSFLGLPSGFDDFYTKSQKKQYLKKVNEINALIQAALRPT